MTNEITEWYRDVRQPDKAFFIAQADDNWKLLTSIATAIEEFLNFLKGQTNPDGPKLSVVKDVLLLFSKIKDGERYLAEMATHIWRSRKCVIPKGYLVRMAEAQPLPEMKGAFKAVLAAWKMLDDHGLQIQDHTGDEFFSGQQLDAEAFEPYEGVKEETIIDTIAPTIYLDGRIIQFGKVVVGTPQ